MPNEEEPKVLLIGQRTSQPSRWLTFLGRTLNDEGFPTEFAGSRGLGGKLTRESYRSAVVDVAVWRGRTERQKARSLVSLIKQHSPTLPIFAAVIFEDYPSIRWAFKTGFTDLFSQNYDRGNLLAVLRERSIIF